MKSFVATITFGLFAALFAIPASGVPQTVAAEKCRADADTWATHPSHLAAANKLSYNDIRQRLAEMKSCYIADAKDTETIIQNVIYVPLANLYQILEINRLTDYIIRHHGSQPSEIDWLGEDKHTSINHPSQNQCRAEFILWSEALQTNATNRMSLRQLYNRQDEMSDCGSAVLETPDGYPIYTKYIWLSLGYNDAAVVRLRARLVSLNEWSPFLIEDAAGMR